VRSGEGFWREWHFITFIIINGLMNEQLWTKTIGLMAPGGFTLGFEISH